MTPRSEATMRWQEQALAEGRCKSCGKDKGGDKRQMCKACRLRHNAGALAKTKRLNDELRALRKFKDDVSQVLARYDRDWMDAVQCVEQVREVLRTPEEGKI